MKKQMIEAIEEPEIFESPPWWVLGTGMSLILTILNYSVNPVNATTVYIITSVTMVILCLKSSFQTYSMHLLQLCGFDYIWLHT